MFPRSERFVEKKIEVTPGPNHYDIKLTEDDPYKRFGFLGKTKRFNNENKPNDQGGLPSHGLYERSSLSASLPSLVIDNGTRSPDTLSIHSNGSITPDYSSLRPSNPRSKSSEKLSTAFAANSSKTEERLRRELAELSDRFGKLRLLHQRDVDGLTEKQKKGEALYQNCLEKSEKTAAQVTEKIGKTQQLQKRIEELEKLNARSKVMLEEQESLTVDLRKKHELERQQLESQFLLGKESSEKELARVNEQQRAADSKFKREIQQVKDESDAWRLKVEALERLVEELERQLAEERKKVADLEEQLRREKERLEALLEEANCRISAVEHEKSLGDAANRDTISSLESTKQALQTQMQKMEQDFSTLVKEHQDTVSEMEEQKQQRLETIQTMTIGLHEQQTMFEEERQSNNKARQDLEASITKLILELAQNRDALINVQVERSKLQEQYHNSQQELDVMAAALEEGKEQHRQLEVDSEKEMEVMRQKYDDLTTKLLQQTEASEAAVAHLNNALDTKTSEYERVMETVNTVKRELQRVESEKSEVIAQRLDEERTAKETLQRLQEQEVENRALSDQVKTMTQDKEVLEAEREHLLGESKVQVLSINSLLSEIEVVRSEKAESEQRDRKRIQELEDIYQVATKQAETFHDNERVWESERVKLVEERSTQRELIDTLQARLEQITMEKEEESHEQVTRTKALELRCQAMEETFKELYDATGSQTELDATSDTEIWQQHSSILSNSIRHHKARCSISKEEHEVLLKEKRNLEQTTANLTTSLQDQEAAYKRYKDGDSDLLAKIKELEDQIRQLQMQVEFLEAENIGKVAIVKALQDEYEYQEKIIKELSKNEEAAKEVPRLEEELRKLTNYTRETDEWIKQVQEDVEKYKAAYTKADIAREETLLDMASLHEQLAESEAARVQTENQLNAEVSVLIKKHELSSDELSRLSKMNSDSAQNQGLKQKVNQIAVLKEENLALKKKSLALSNTRDNLRLKCLQLERDLESYKAALNNSSASPSTPRPTVHSSSNRKHSGSISGSSVVSTSSVTLTEVVVSNRSQGQSESVTTPRSTSPLSSASSSPTTVSKTLMAQPRTSTLLLTKPLGITKSGSKTPIQSRAARSFAGQSGNPK
ncbi:hypothetical protein BG004_004000 [Podila humilis]|nr:hypothetical protein BG004_004000 [Podila humilis]